MFGELKVNTGNLRHGLPWTSYYHRLWSQQARSSEPRKAVWKTAHEASSINESSQICQQLPSTPLPYVLGALDTNQQEERQNRAGKSLSS